ncbi:glycerol-3-phosphate 1-O-acyltransferase PlsY [Mycoplasmatota bacterium]|nr:glycerol-3-phosphate 1-O-acyltransferase PlsY [Mycoplasmatota bacterium]
MLKVRTVLTLNIYNELIYLLICYLIGSIPSGLIVGKLSRNVDIRNHGSGNLGGTNAIRVLGKTLGGIVVLLDVMKGVTSVFLAYYIFQTDIPTIMFGITAVVGHVFPIFAKFRGGKAVATSAGVLIFSSPIILFIGLAAFIITLVISRYVSLSSTLAAIIIFLSSIISYIYQDEPFFKYFYSDIYLVITIGIFLLFILWRHIPNYKRLFNKTERRI